MLAEVISATLSLAARRCAIACCALVAVLAASASAASAASVSSNWAGYVAAPHANAGSRFSSVSGTWQQPVATCSAGREAFSAAWVGLGGASERAGALEQVGTDADCSHAGHPAYSAWYELIPAGPVNVPIRVRPGDQLSASVTVRGHRVTLRLRDLTSGARFTTTRHVSEVDASTAEWIVEAPSICIVSCGQLPLTDFGSVVFSSATATAGAHTGTLLDGDWSTGAIELRENARRGLAGRPGARLGLTSAVISAIPSPAAPTSGAFSVAWLEQSTASEAPAAPAMPGLNGGPPS
jgi:hypothetical protein